MTTKWQRSYAAHREARKAYSRAYYRAQDPRQKKMLRLAKKRAKKAGLEFSLSVSDIYIPSRCPVFGTPTLVGTGFGQRNEAATLDRVNNAKGYVPGNVVVISYRANRIKNDATLGELQKLVAFYERLPV